jgi:chorismate mutase
VSKIQQALNRVIRAAHFRGMSTRLTKESAIVDTVDAELYANVTRSEAAVLALFSEREALCEELAEALTQALELIRRSNREERALTVTDALDLPLVLPALAHYQEAAK